MKYDKVQYITNINKVTILRRNVLVEKIPFWVLYSGIQLRVGFHANKDYYIVTDASHNEYNFFIGKTIKRKLTVKING